jgi:WD40 repeat protein
VRSPCFQFLLIFLHCCIGHDDRAWHVAWNPAKPLLATCSADKSVRLYTYTPDPSPNFVLHTSIPTGHTKTVRGIAWSPSGHTLATASFDANIGIWQREDQEDEVGGEWECVTILEGHETECKSVSWSPTGTFLASCSRDKTVWVWEGVSPQTIGTSYRSSTPAQPDADFECMGVLMEHTQDVKCVAWHPREEVDRSPTPRQAADAHPRSIDLSVCLVRRHDQALPR